MEPIINEPTGHGKYAPVKCCGCKGDHYLNNCPEKKNKDVIVYNLKEASIVVYIARNIVCIYASLEIAR